MSNLYIISILRALVLIALQILVLSRIGLGETWATYVQPQFYPLIILLLPVGMPSVVVLGIAFLVGIIIDISLGSYGVHAGALVFTAYLRGLILGLVEPRDGYSVGQSPTPHVLGMNSFALYAALLLFAHFLAYFSLEIFTYVYIGEIILRTLGSFTISFIFIYLYALVVNPRV